MVLGGVMLLAYSRLTQFLAASSADW